MLSRFTQVASITVAAMLVLVCCSEDVVESSEPTGQLLIATNRAGSKPADNQSIVQILDVATGVHKELTLDADHVFNARWRPDGGAVLVEAILDVDAPEDRFGPSLYLADLDDFELTPLEGFPRGSSYSDPDWGPKCDSLVVRRDSSLWQVAIDGSGESELVDLGGVLSRPDWSGDGSRLTFERRSDGEVWMLERDGSAPTLILGEADGYGGSPRLSPDGEQILFIRNVEHDDGHFVPQLFVHDLDDRDSHQITEGPNGAWDAVWSPDGEWIAFSDGFSWVTIVRPDGSDQRRTETKGLPLDWGPVTAACDDDVA